jgi:hypothetical protein
MKVLEIKKKKPSVQEAERRLESLFSEFIERGADAEFVALLFFTFGTSRVFDYSTTIEQGILKIDEILENSFGLTKEIEFIPDFTPEKDK